MVRAISGFFYDEELKKYFPLNTKRKININNKEAFQTEINVRYKTLESCKSAINEFVSFVSMTQGLNLIDSISNFRINRLKIFECSQEFGQLIGLISNSTILTKDGNTFKEIKIDIENCQIILEKYVSIPNHWNNLTFGSSGKNDTFWVIKNPENLAQFDQELEFLYFRDFKIVNFRRKLCLSQIFPFVTVTNLNSLIIHSQMKIIEIESDGNIVNICEISKHKQITAISFNPVLGLLIGITGGQILRYFKTGIWIKDNNIYSIQNSSVHKFFDLNGFEVLILTLHGEFIIYNMKTLNSVNLFHLKDFPLRNSNNVPIKNLKLCQSNYFLFLGYEDTNEIVILPINNLNLSKLILLRTKRKLKDIFETKNILIIDYL